MILDLFAGPGGWDEGLRLLGRDYNVLGVEWDEGACATAEAAGHQRVRADVRSLSPHKLVTEGVEGLIASPPCQPFSENGKRGGLTDPRGELVHEAMRYVAELRPTWVAFEQVKTVLPIWRDHAATLRDWGYSAWAGVLDAADFGVPQHRLRAVLVARRDGEQANLPAIADVSGTSRKGVRSDGPRPGTSTRASTGRRGSRARLHRKSPSLDQRQP